MLSPSILSRVNDILENYFDGAKILSNELESFGFEETDSNEFIKNRIEEYFLAEEENAHLNEIMMQQINNGLIDHIL